MPANHLHLIAACLAMALLTAVVGLTMLRARVREMRSKRLHAQRIANSVQMSAQLEDIQPADNFRNLFEVPVLFYTLTAIALAAGEVPRWLVVCAWVFVGLRVVHSFIHCTYNKVFHRLAVFLASFAVLIGMWVAFFVSIAVRVAQ